MQILAGASDRLADQARRSIDADESVRQDEQGIDADENVQNQAAEERGLFDLSRDPVFWRMPPGSYINLTGAGERQGLVLFHRYVVKESAMQQARQDASDFFIVLGEKSWRFGQLNALKPNNHPTITSRCEPVMCIAGALCCSHSSAARCLRGPTLDSESPVAGGAQLRWELVAESWDFMGALCNVLVCKES